VIIVLAVAATLAVKSHRDRVPKGAIDPARTQKSSSPEEALDAALAGHKPVWLLIHSTMCIPCREMEMISASLKPEFEGKVVFVNVIIDDPKAGAILKKYKIELIPTSYFINSDGKVVEKKVGAIPMAELRKKLLKLAGARG